VYSSANGILVFTQVAIKNQVTFHYNVPIGIGSQRFKAVIDLQWADLWVVSRKCTHGGACGRRSKYDATRSATYEPNGTAMNLSFPIWPNLYGNISDETVTLGDSLKVEHHPFVELAEWQGHMHEFDAALGLAPEPTLYGHPDDSQPRLPSPFMGLVESKQLEKNIFSLLLPYDRNDIGDLSFGTSHREFHDGPLVSHQIYPANASKWQIEAPGISMRHHNGTGMFNHSLSGRSAVLDSILLDKVAWLPKTLFMTILHATNATVYFGDCPVVQFPCDKISELPDLVLNFGNQEIVLKGEDYVGKSSLPQCSGGPYCMPLIGDIGTLNGKEDGPIVLGSRFLKKVYSVFDWDDRTVSCKSWAYNWYDHLLTGTFSCTGQTSILWTDLVARCHPLDTTSLSNQCMPTVFVRAHTPLVLFASMHELCHWTCENHIRLVY
jgi:saccharopepsin